jgi:hypothetical protein
MILHKKYKMDIIDKEMHKDSLVNEIDKILKNRNYNQNKIII